MKASVKKIVLDISTEGLDSFKHRVIGVTLKSDVEERIITDRDEKVLLEEFWNYMRMHKFDIVIGFNSDAFDIPFLLMRSIKHSVPIFNIGDKSVDLRKRLSFGQEKPRGKLSDFKELLNLQPKNYGYDKMHMSLLWEDSSLYELEVTLLDDVHTTWELYDHLKRGGLL